MAKFLAFSSLKKSVVKDLLQNLSTWYNCDTNHLNKYSFYITNRDKVYISTIDVNSLDIDRINAIGMYFGTFHDDNRFRLSLEGSKLLEPTRNYVKLNKESFESYISGENLFTKEVDEVDWQDHAPFVIVVYDDENLGCVSVKEDTLLTYLPKSRKLNFNKVF